MAPTTLCERPHRRSKHDTGTVCSPVIWTPYAANVNAPSESQPPLVLFKSGEKAVLSYSQSDEHWKLNLPECLQFRADGAIVVSGHRVTLFAVLQAIAELDKMDAEVTAGHISDFFPSITIEQIASVLKYIAVNPVAMKQYFDAESRLLTQHSVRFAYIGPTLEELRQRQDAGK